MRKAESIRFECPEPRCSSFVNVVKHIALTKDGKFDPEVRILCLKAVNHNRGSIRTMKPVE